VNTSASHHDVVHLVAAPSANAGTYSLGRTIPTVLCAQAIEQRLTPPGRVILIGDTSCESQARMLGLNWHTRLTPPLGKPELLRRRVKQLTKGATRVICWNDELAPILTGIRADIDLISTSPANAPDHISKRITIRAFEQGDCDFWIDRGNIASVDRVLPPILDHLADSNRSISLTSIGVHPDAICIGVLSDRPSDVDARELAFLLGLLNASGYTLTGIVPTTANNLAAARRHHRGLGSPFQFLVAADPITSILPIFDALIHPCFDGSGSSMLIERMCENADVPVLRLKESAREGLSRSPAVAGPIIEFLDEIIKSNKASQPELTNV